MAIIDDRIVVPELVNADRTSPNFGATGQTRVEDITLQEPELLTQIAEVAEQQIAGQIPEDVQQEVLQITAEKGISTGVAGQAGEFLTAQQLGLTSLDIQQQGIQTGLAVAGLQSERELAEKNANTQIAMFNEDLNRDFNTLQLESQQIEDKFLGMSREAELDEAALELRVLETISANKQFFTSVVRDVALANAKNNVPGAQDLINQWSRYFRINNAAIAELFGITDELGFGV